MLFRLKQKNTNNMTYNNKNWITNQMLINSLSPISWVNLVSKFLNNLMRLSMITIHLLQKSMNYLQSIILKSAKMSVLLKYRRKREIEIGKGTLKKQSLHLNLPLSQLPPQLKVLDPDFSTSMIFSTGLDVNLLHVSIQNLQKKSHLSSLTYQSLRNQSSIN
jgi:hypothetical protein